MSRKVGGREATKGVIPGRYCPSVGNPDLDAAAGWSWRPLSELARLESGHTPSRRKPEYWGGRISWIGIKDATGNHGEKIFDTIQHTNELGIANSAARILPANTVCLSRTASVGYVVVMGKPISTSQDFANFVCGPDLDYRFLKYALVAENEALHSFSHGSTHRTIYYPELKAFHICAPDIDEQIRVADILQLLDDKIELNRKTAATLEEMARALYRSWFVDFDPVQAKAAGLAPTHMDTPTAALFPARFGDDGLPEGWCRTSIGALAKCILGGTPSRANQAYWGGDIPWINSGAVNKFRIIGPSERISLEGLKKSAAKMLPIRTTVLAITGATLGQVSLTEIEVCANQSVVGVVAGEGLQEFMYCSINETIDDLIKHQTGGAQQHINKGNVEDHLIICGTDDLHSAFSKAVKDFIDLIGGIQFQCETLAALRDTLLPRLMSGELRVAEAREQVEEAI